MLLHDHSQASLPMGLVSPLLASAANQDLLWDLLRKALAANLHLTEVNLLLTEISGQPPDFDFLNSLED